MKKSGKQTKINIEANKKLKAMYLEKGITRCEVCNSDFILGFHHWPFRSSSFYKNKPELLSSFKHTILVCQKCHKPLHDEKWLNEEVFITLRGR